MSPLPRQATDSGVASRTAGRVVAFIGIWVVLTHGKPILMPLVLAILISFLILPIVGALTARGWPGMLAIAAALTTAAAPILLQIFVFIASVGPLQSRLPKYQASLTRKVNYTIDATIDRIGLGERRETLKRELQQDLLPKLMEGGATLAQAGLRTATTAVGYFLLTLLMAGFILVEGRRFREKLTEAVGADNVIARSLEAIGGDVRSYVVAKTLLSGLTALCVWLFLLICGVDFAAFWGLMAFPLNFIPTVGAMIASVPPILVAIVDPEFSLWGVIGVSVGLVAVNGVIGSVLDPRFVGNRVKLSPLVVLLSMLVWGLLWGPVGMILAVPIMVSFKVICSHVPGLQPIATLMKA